MIVGISLVESGRSLFCQAEGVSYFSRPFSLQKSVSCRQERHIHAYNIVICDFFQYGRDSSLLGLQIAGGSAHSVVLQPISNQHCHSEYLANEVYHGDNKGVTETEISSIINGQNNSAVSASLAAVWSSRVGHHGVGEFFFGSTEKNRNVMRLARYSQQ